MSASYSSLLWALLHMALTPRSWAPFSDSARSSTILIFRRQGQEQAILAASKEVRFLWRIPDSIVRSFRLSDTNALFSSHQWTVFRRRYIRMPPDLNTSRRLWAEAGCAVDLRNLHLVSDPAGSFGTSCHASRRSILQRYRVSPMCMMLFWAMVGTGVHVKRVS